MIQQKSLVEIGTDGVSLSGNEWFLLASLLIIAAVAVLIFWIKYGKGE